VVSEGPVSNRAMDLLRFIENKYVSILEDVIAEEAEIKAKKERTVIDEIRLLGLEAIKKHIAEELGLPYNEESSLLVTLGGEREEASIEA
jgi:chemotaxis regulatin CheY-phosphate phosphatase CheZ